MSTKVKLGSTKIMPSCTELHCSKKVKSSGQFCPKHTVRQLNLRCSLKDCDRYLRNKTSSICAYHLGLEYKKKLPTCSVLGCQRIGELKSLCHMHYRRKNKFGITGSAETLRAMAGSGCEKDGYRVICLNGKNGIYEHRHVMSQFLGRELFAFENVHHLNGNKSDNRLENLELWIVKQPPGQRIIDVISYFINTALILGIDLPDINLKNVTSSNISRKTLVIPTKYQAIKPTNNVYKNDLAVIQLASGGALYEISENLGAISKEYRTFKRKGTRIPVHHMVMGTYLGREIYPNERIHHLNSIKNDNRIENLELWVLSQPAGSRLTDLLKILSEKYPKEFLSYLKSKQGDFVNV